MKNLDDIILPNITSNEIDLILFVAENQKTIKDIHNYSPTKFCGSYQETDLKIVRAILRSGSKASILQYPRFANYDIDKLKKCEPNSEDIKYEFGYSILESIKTIEKIQNAYKVFDKISIYVSSNIITSKFGKTLYTFLRRYGHQLSHPYYKVFYFDSIEYCQEVQSILFNIIKSDFEAPTYIWSTIKKLESIIKYLSKID